MDNNNFWNDTWDKDQKQEALRLKGPIFIVGASGFIGANLFYSLSALRNDVFACSRNPQKSWRLTGVDSGKMINLDITDFSKLSEIINDYRPSTVFNLAAYGAYSRQTDPDKIHTTNYLGTLNLLEALSETGCSAYVHAGTSSEYGLNCKAPSENSELIPNSDYAVSKVSASYLIKYFGKIRNFPATDLRFYSVYGPWEDRDRLIPGLISNGLQGKFPHFADKLISRDFVYIDDCTNAFVKAALTICLSDRGISVNIATGTKTTLEDVADKAKEIFNIKENPSFGTMQNRKWDLAEWYGDPALAENLLGWKYKISFTEGLKHSLKWEQEFAAKIQYAPVPGKERKISAIIACYKDDRSIPILYKQLKEVFDKSGYDFEIIFVNDSSPDNDEDEISKLCYLDSHVIGISHSRSFGSQSAFVSGMELSSGNAVVLLDGDGQDPPEIIPDFISKWEEGYDVVYGQRVRREAPLYMQIFYKLFYRMFRSLSEVAIPVDAGDFSLIDKKVVNYILKFTEKDIFLRGLRAWVGFRQIGVPYKRPERLFGVSTNSFARNLWWAKKGIFSFSKKPLQYIQTLGFIVFIITICLSLFYLIEYFINPPSDAHGIPTIILIMLGLGGIQLISISVLGDYLGKVIDEVKNRPKFIRSKIFHNGKSYTDESMISDLVQKIHKNKNIR
jgi:polyisoprenyl-phosphate glycosyltransferase